jgi:hypothetical protein
MFFGMAWPDAGIPVCSDNGSLDRSERRITLPEVRAGAQKTVQIPTKWVRLCAGKRHQRQVALFPVYKDTMVRASSGVLVAALGVFLCGSPTRAHHSFAAEYDAQKPIRMSGSVTKVEWTNPHVHFYMTVKDERGTVSEWEFSMGAVNGLLRRGWRTTMLKPGDTVTVDGYLARDGSRLANARIVTLSDGRKMSGGTIPDAPGN